MFVQLAKAIQEQQLMIHEKEKRIQALEARLDKLEKMVSDK